MKKKSTYKASTSEETLYHNFRNLIDFMKLLKAVIIVGQNQENMNGAEKSKGLTSSNEKRFTS